MQHPALKLAILDALRIYVRQRPGLDFANYGDWAVFRSESRRITRQLNDAELLIDAVELRQSITADDILAEATERERLTITMTGALVGISYTTGQYWPTEYRAAVCRLLSRVLWRYWADDLPPCSADEVRRIARLEMGLPLSRRWFA